jgi:hypothetical protein
MCLTRLGKCQQLFLPTVVEKYKEAPSGEQSGSAKIPTFGYGSFCSENYGSCVSLEGNSAMLSHLSSKAFHGLPFFQCVDKEIREKHISNEFG